MWSCGLSRRSRVCVYVCVQACGHVHVCECVVYSSGGMGGRGSCLFKWTERGRMSPAWTVASLCCLWKQNKKRRRRGEKKEERTRGGRESRKLEPVTDNNAVCSVTETWCHLSRVPGGGGRAVGWGHTIVLHLPIVCVCLFFPFLFLWMNLRDAQWASSTSARLKQWDFQVVHSCRGPCWARCSQSIREAW